MSSRTRRLRRLLSTIPVVVAAAFAAAPASAVAAPCEVRLEDPVGGVWDVSNGGPGLGQVNDIPPTFGGSWIGDGGLDTSAPFDGVAEKTDAYDSWPALQLSANGGTNWTGFAPANNCTYEDGNREISYPAQTIFGLDVTRKIYVPATGLAFARFLNILQNPGASPVTVTLDLGGGAKSSIIAPGLGSDDLTTVADSSSGDGVTGPAGTIAPMDERDNWATTFEHPNDPTSDPPLAHNWQIDGEAVGVDRVDGVFFDAENADKGALAFQANSVTVQPGQTAIYMTTEAIRADNAQTSAAARAIGAEPPDLFAGMSQAEVNALRNWTGGDADRDGVQTAADNCPRAANADQADNDGDSLGDACDADDDNDGFSDAVEVALGINPLVRDSDGDGTIDGSDSCPKLAGPGGDGCPVAAAPGGGAAPGSSVRDSTAPALALTVPASIKRKAFLKGVTATVTCDEPCTVEGELLGSARSVRLAAAFNLTLGSKSLRLGGGSRKLKIKPSRRLVGKAKKLKVQLRVTATDASGNRTRKTQTIRVK
jgi:hypothetical protein